MGSLNLLPLLPLKLGFVADLLPFYGFSASNLLLCGAIGASTGASRRKYCREWSESLGVGFGSSYGASGGGVWPLSLVVELVIFGLRKKNASGSEDRLILLPLITQGSFPKHPENLRRKIEWDVVDAIAKETRSLKLRYCADPRHLLFLR